MLFFVIILFIILFFKEFIVINPELVVIAGFLTIFFVLKSAMEELFVTMFSEYAENIRKTFEQNSINNLSLANKSIDDNNSLINLQNQLDNYYHAFINTNLVFIDRTITANTISSKESIEIAFNRIIQHIREMKRNGFKNTILTVLKKKNIHPKPTIKPIKMQKQQKSNLVNKSLKMKKTTKLVLPPFSIPLNVVSNVLVNKLPNKVKNK